MSLLTVLFYFFIFKTKVCRVQMLGVSRYALIMHLFLIDKNVRNYFCLLVLQQCYVHSVTVSGLQVKQPSLGFTATTRSCGKSVLHTMV